MKFFVLGLVLLALYGMAMCDYKQLAIDCMAEFNVTKEDLKVLHSGAIKSTDVPQNQKCLGKCLLERLGAINATTGELLVGLEKEKFPIIQPIMAKCKPTVSSDPCDNAYRVMRCIWQQKADVM